MKLKAATTMKDKMAAIWAALSGARATGTHDAVQYGKPAKHGSDDTIGRLISVLDDRNVSAAIRVLEPPGESSDHERESRRPRCVGCGE